MVVTTLFGGLAVLSLILNLWAWLAGRRFPLHQAPSASSEYPAVILLKPLKGCDAETPTCLESWLVQDYAGPCQILFGVSSKEDPAIPIVRDLLLRFPTVDARLVFCLESLGPNGKMSTLSQLYPFVRDDLVVVSDADVRVAPDFLKQITPLLGPGRAALVSCFYKSGNPANAAMHWEAIAVNADFWTQVLQSKSLRPLDFALGAVMAVTGEMLERCGGFRAWLNTLADDFELGQAVARVGGRIDISPVVVECRSNPMGWKEVWRHQLRWARTIRICRPVPYFFSFLSNGTFWPLVWISVSPGGATLAGAVLCLSLRVMTALDNCRRLAGPVPVAPYLGLILLKDLLQTILWFAAFLGNQVEWRGEKYRVDRHGLLKKQSENPMGR